MPSNGKEVFALLMVNFPQAEASMAEHLKQAWRREFAKAKWDTEIAKDALSAYLRLEKPRFLPALPILVDAIEQRHQQIHRRTHPPQTNRDDPPPSEATKIVRGVFDRAAKAEPFVPRPNWDTSHFMVFRAWKQDPNHPLNEEEVVNRLSRLARQKKQASLADLRTLEVIET